MGLWNKGLNRNKKRTKPTAAKESSETPQQAVGQQVVATTQSTAKVIDWEERHFQICLAILSCPEADSAGFARAPILDKTIEKADRMVALLKEHASKEIEAEESNEGHIIPKKITSIGASQKGDNKPESESGKPFDAIWRALEALGYTQGSDIPYFHFNECCEGLDIDVNTVDINGFREKYDVNIG